MRWSPMLCLGLLIPGPGCNIAYYSARNIVNEPAQQLSELRLRHRFREMGRAAWDEECRNAPSQPYSDASRDGFIDGYADHLDNGGPPQPPAAPPPRYRRHPSDFTPAGMEAERDYLAGFYRGAVAAAASGCRQALVVQIALPETQAEVPLSITCVPAAVAPKPMGPPMPIPMPPPGSPPAGVPLPQPTPVTKGPMNQP